MEECQVAFVQVEKALCGEPVLHTPNFFLLERERWYNTVEKEFLAIQWLLEMPIHFVWNTSHWLQCMKDAIAWITWD